MKTFVLFAGLLALGCTLRLPKKPVVTEVQDVAYKQQVVLDLLLNIGQANVALEKIGVNYDIQANIQNYRVPQYVTDFVRLQTLTLLPRGQPFTVFDPEQREEAIAFFRVLYNAVDFDTLYKTAAWGRMFLNEGLYVYSLSVALVQRPDTYFIELPAVYEIYPNLFYDTDVLQQVQQIAGVPMGVQYPSEAQKSYRLPYYFGNYVQQGQGMGGQQRLYQGQQGLFQGQQVPIGGLQGQQGVLQGTQGLYQNQQGPIGGIQGLQGLFQGQQGPIGGIQGVLQGRQGLFQGQQGPVGGIQNQQGPIGGIQGLQGLFQGQQGPIGGIQGQQGVLQGRQRLFQGQQGPVGGVQNQQGLYQNQQGPIGGIQGQQGVLQGRQGLFQGQQGPVEDVQNQQGLYQNQQGPIGGMQGLQGLFQGQQGPVGGIQGQQGVFQGRQGLFQGQQGPVEGVQNQQGLYQNQQGPIGGMQGLQGLFQGQQGPVGGIQGQQGVFQGRQGLFQGQQGPVGGIQGQQGVLQGQQGLYQGPVGITRKQQLYQGLMGVLQRLQEQQDVNQGPIGGVQPQQGLYQGFQGPIGGVQNKEGLYQRPIVGRVPLQQNVGQPELLRGLQQQVVQNPIGLGPSNMWLNNMVVGNPRIAQLLQGILRDIQQEREKEGSQGIVVDADITNPVDPIQDPESLINYFTQDVGLNAFYYYYNIYFPFWLSNEEIYFNTERRGEQFYYIYQQLLARYNLERISNGLPELPILDLNLPIQNGDQWNMINQNGVQDNITLALMNWRIYEQRILEAIDSGFVLTRTGKLVSIFEPQGFEILGNLIQANPESPNIRYYGNILGIAKSILSLANYPLDQYNVVPGVMEQYETTLRDSAFFQLVKRIIYLFQRYQQNLPSYTQDQLLLSGVKIQDVQVDQLITYFDNFYTDISGSINQQVPVQIQQQRLNHLPFNYYLNVVSEKPVEAVVRVFLGPKYDVNGNVININKDRLNFVELDKFQYSLVPGLNTIQRNSRDFYGYAQDRTTYRQLFMQLATNQITPVPSVPQIQWGMPQRLVLPRGNVNGQVYQVYFLVTPYQPVVQKSVRKSSKSHPMPQQQPLLFWDRVFDSLPIGYPFDRVIDEGVFYVPNSIFQDVVIYNLGNGIGEPMIGQNQNQVPFQVPVQRVV